MKLKLIFKLTLLVLTTCCYSQTSLPGSKINSKKISKSSTVSYFPLNYFPQHNCELKHDSLIDKILPNQFDTSAVIFFSHFLIKAKEPILFNRKTTSDIFRFVWLRTFDEPIIIKVEKNGNAYKIFLKIFEGKAGYGIGSVKTRKERTLSTQEWCKFIDLIESSTFGKKCFSRNIILPEDGSEWLLERVNEKGYFAASENSPSKGPFFSACMYLVELTNIILDEQDKY